MERRGVERRGCFGLHAAMKGRNRRALKGGLSVSRTKCSAATRKQGRDKRWMESEFWGASEEGGGLSVHDQPLPAWLSLIYQCKTR